MINWLGTRLLYFCPNILYSKMFFEWIGSVLIFFTRFVIGILFFFNCRGSLIEFQSSGIVWYVIYPTHQAPHVCCIKVAFLEFRNWNVFLRFLYDLRGVRLLFELILISNGVAVAFICYGDKRTDSRKAKILNLSSWPHWRNFFNLKPPHCVVLFV